MRSICGSRFVDHRGEAIEAAGDKHTGQEGVEEVERRRAHQRRARKNNRRSTPQTVSGR